MSIANMIPSGYFGVGGRWLGVCRNDRCV